MAGNRIREETSKADFTLSIFRNGERLEQDGNYNFSSFVMSVEIFESIASSCMEATLTFTDSGGYLGVMTGSEKFRLQISSYLMDRDYYFRSYEIKSRTKINEFTDTFIVNLVSDEFLRNEVKNVFGNTSVIFKKNNESNAIVKDLIKDKKYIGTRKRFFGEETINKQNFVASNWRPFDTIYWIAQRSIRKAKKGGTLQNGFAFWENALGFNFKSLDKMIDEVNDQGEEDTNFTSGKAKTHTYTFATRGSDAGSSDPFKILGLSFPQERNFLLGLRDGDWSGYSVGFDPVTISQSKMGLSTDMSIDAYRYSISESWQKMSHLGGKKEKSILKQMDTDIQDLIDYPKRVRYTIMPNQIFDPKFKDNPQKNYEALVELQAYQWMRIESLKSVKMLVRVPGNLDLYSGKGVNIVVPATVKTGENTIVDAKYSGRYLIQTVVHKLVNEELHTEMMLLKDSVV